MPGVNWKGAKTSLTIGFAAFGLLSLMGLAGCGRDEFELGEVTGVVTYDGEPLRRANVVFQPKEGVGTTSVGFTNDDGRYLLRFSRRAVGAIVGPHEVVINVWPTEENPKPIKVPAKYNTATELSAEVKAGTNSFDFELVSDKGTKKK